MISSDPEQTDTDVNDSDLELYTQLAVALDGTADPDIVVVIIIITNNTRGGDSKDGLGIFA